MARQLHSWHDALKPTHVYDPRKGSSMIVARLCLCVCYSCQPRPSSHQTTRYTPPTHLTRTGTERYQPSYVSKSSTHICRSCRSGRFCSSRCFSSSVSSGSPSGQAGPPDQKLTRERGGQPRNASCVRCCCSCCTGGA